MNNKKNINYKIQSILAYLSMLITQDISLKLFFRRKIVIGKEFLSLSKGSIVFAPTHRSRWDGLILTFAIGRRVTKKDCRFMVTKPEMSGIQGWFLKRLGCFSIDQESPSLSSLRYALNLIVSNQQLVIFPEGKINRNRKKISLKQGLFRLANLANKKGVSVTIIPIGIAYDEMIPKFRGEVALCLERPIIIDDYYPNSIDKFNEILRKRIDKAESKALSLVGRKMTT